MRKEGEEVRETRRGQNEGVKMRSKNGGIRSGGEREHL